MKEIKKHLARMSYKAMNDNKYAHEKGDDIIFLITKMIKKMCSGSYEFDNACGLCFKCKLVLKGMRRN